MKDKTSQSSFWIIALAVICCGLPLLIITSGGSILALISGFLSNNTFLLLLGVTLAGLAIWIFLKREGEIK